VKVTEFEVLIAEPPDHNLNPLNNSFIMSRKYGRNTNCTLRYELQPVRQLSGDEKRSEEEGI
jgi:hypothetical protein